MYRKELASLARHLKAIFRFGQFKAPLNACGNLVVVCKDIIP